MQEVDNATNNVSSVNNRIENGTVGSLEITCRNEFVESSMKLRTYQKQR
jgi:hypothetical protein